jgi:hypothetical protein
LTTAELSLILDAPVKKTAVFRGGNAPLFLGFRKEHLMRLRLSWVVFGLLVPTLAYADDHWADNYAGFSAGGGGSNVKGFHQTFALEFPHSFLAGNFAVVPADFSVQFGEDVTQVNYMLGARYAVAGDPQRLPHKLLVQALVGVVYTNDAADADVTNKDPGVSLGVGYEYAKYRTPWSIRFMYDRIKRFGDRDESFNRFSAGMSYRWTRE